MPHKCSFFGIFKRSEELNCYSIILNARLMFLSNDSMQSKSHREARLYLGYITNKNNLHIFNKLKKHDFYSVALVRLR